VISTFLAPTFAGSRLFAMEPSTADAWIGLIVGALVGATGISIAFVIWIREPGAAARLQDRMPALHTFLYNKWYFDEIIDFLVVRPAQLSGRFAQTVLEDGLIAGGVTGSGTGIVRAASAAVRRAQTGFLRYYVALMIVGVGAVALYFLIAST
jgi:NADH-quinone oxidoreductase subunit L